MKKILITFLLLLISFPLYSDIQTDLQKAQDNYKNGDYGQTIKIYETVISNGFSNPVIYYNLANSYMKINEIGKASLNNERALMLTPRDKDIRTLKTDISKLINIAKQYPQGCTK